MALSKETEYGKITVSNELFKDTILRALTHPGMKDRIWLANKPSLEAEYDEEGRINLEFSVIAQFGVPIKRLCKILSDNIAKQIQQRSGRLPSQIKVNVVGVKSKNVVKRSMEVVCEY